MEVTGKDLKVAVHGLMTEYKRVKKIYDTTDKPELKENALQGMANILQLQSVAIQNFENWKHIEREDKKLEE